MFIVVADGVADGVAAGVRVRAVPGRKVAGPPPPRLGGSDHAGEAGHHAGQGLRCRRVGQRRPPSARREWMIRVVEVI